MDENSLNLLIESLLISLLYEKETATLELVSDYALNRQQYGSKANSVRKFIKLAFHQISNITFKPGLRLIPLLEPSGYSTCNSPQTIVFQQIQANNSELYLDFGYSYGELTFRHMNVSKQTRVTYVTRLGDSAFQYFDLGTNKPVKFCYPFD